MKDFRHKFIIPERNGKEQIYFLGNSLGLQPRNTAEAIGEILYQWSHYGVEGFFEGEKPWLKLHDSLTEPLAEIVGCLPSEVVVMNHLTVNLHLLMASFYRPDKNKFKIICEAKAFPSDQYMLETQVKHHGLDPDKVIIEVHPREGEYIIHHEDILATIEKHKQELALVLWGGVNYYTGQLFDMQSIAAAAHAAGAKIGLDLAHAVGNVALQLHDWNIDFAAWCSYKYLNSGPGGVAGAYIHERYHNNTVPRLAGWWGYEKETRFKMLHGFKPVNSAEGWQLSTPPMMLLAAHKASLDIFQEAGMSDLVKQGIKNSDLLIELLKQETSSKIDILTPDVKGCQVSVLIKKEGKSLFDQLSKHGVFADWREPDVIRVAPVPLYNTTEEIKQFANIFKKILA